MQLGILKPLEMDKNRSDDLLMERMCPVLWWIKAQRRKRRTVQPILSNTAACSVIYVSKFDTAGNPSSVSTQRDPLLK